jgi:hypothetical protein
MEQLQKVLEKHKELLCRILILTRQQPLLIESDNIVELMDCIEARQELIDQLNEIQLPQDEIEAARERFPKEVDEINQLLTVIRKQDDENGDAATQKLEELRKSLQSINSGKKTLAYEGMPMSPDSTMLSRKG